MTKRKHLVALAISLLAAACTGEAPQHEARVATAAAPAPQRAGQPVDPLKTAGHIAAARVAAIHGNQEGVRRKMEAMNEEMRRAMKLPAASRPLDPQPARPALPPIHDLRSLAWADPSNPV